jgi:2-dehydropantoate 2-reductase
METLVIGPGAIGCLLAGLLTRSGQTVYLLDHKRDRAERIADQGLRIETSEGIEHYPASISADPSELPPPDLALVCVKAYSTSSALKHACYAMTDKTLVVSVQNGLGNYQQIARRIPPHRVFAGSTLHGATRIADGYVRHAGRGTTLISPCDPTAISSADEIASYFNAAGIETTCVADRDVMIWRKLVLNAAINPLTAIHGLPNGALLENSTIRSTMHATVAEATRVAKKKDARLALSDPEGEADRVCHATAGNISSMLQDIQAGRKTEIDSITGSLVDEANRLGVPTPINSDLLVQVRRLESRNP